VPESKKIENYKKQMEFKKQGITIDDYFKDHKENKITQIIYIKKQYV